MDFEDKMNVIFEKELEDEDNIDVYDDLYKDEEDPEEEERKINIKKQLGDEDDDLSLHVDWTGIPNPPAGKTLDDMKELRVMGPPIKVIDGELTLADSSLVYDEKKDEYGYPEIQSIVSIQEYNALRTMAENDDDPRQEGALKALKGLYPVNEDGDEIKVIDGVPQSKPAAYQKRGARFQGGKITANVWKKFPSKMQKEFKPVDEDGNEVNIDDENLSHFERSRAGMDKEFLIGEDESRWYFDDVVRSLKPYAMGIARKISTPTYSQHEAFTDAVSGIRQAWLTDLGRSPFHNHAYKTMLASVKDAANRARNIAGEKTSKGGVRQYASAYKGAVSADAPIGGVDDGDATIAATLEKDLDASEMLDKHDKMTSLIYGLAYLDEVGLSPSERSVFLRSYGYDDKNPGKPASYTDPKTGEKIYGPVPISHMADKVGVSTARISQHRSNAMNKIKRFVDAHGFESMEDAIEKFGLNVEEAKQAVGVLIESMISIIELECEMLSETKRINIKTNVNDISRSLVLVIDSDTNQVCSILDESNEIFNNKVDGSVIREAIINAKILSGGKYFSEMASQILKMNMQPVLAVIGDKIVHDEDEDDEDNS